MYYRKPNLLLPFILVILLVLPVITFAQIGAIKKSSEQNQQQGEQRTSSQNNTGNASNTNTTTNNTYNRYEYSDGDDVATGGCDPAPIFSCLTGCFNFIPGIIKEISKEQAELMTHKDSIRELKMLEIMPQAAFATNNGIVSLFPRIRGVIGLFSTDLRISQLAETKAGADVYSTIDWSLIQFSPINTSNYHLRLGFGFMYEKFSNIYFDELYMGQDIKWSNGVNSNLDLRVAIDTKTGITPRFEMNLRTNIAIINKAPLHIYAMVGALYQNYYEATQVWSLQSGFMLRLD